jgi:cytochrome c5
MNYVTLLSTLATLSLAACDQSEDTPATMETSPARVQPAASPVTSAPASPAEQAVAAGEVSSPAATPDLARGEHIYRQACAFCHDKGVAGAPKIGDAGAWSPRLAQGLDTLYASALHGRNAMPARGGNPSLADADVRAAVDYLAAQAS